MKLCMGHPFIYFFINELNSAKHQWKTFQQQPRNKIFLEPRRTHKNTVRKRDLCKAIEATDFHTKNKCLQLIQGSYAFSKQLEWVYHKKSKTVTILL